MQDDSALPRPTAPLLMQRYPSRFILVSTERLVGRAGFEPATN
ncbi:hypothetical protein SeJ_A1130 [Salmonella enterica subsp. enterica serovar Javiana str. GA_MM04042433]|nr:hypothetical protein SeJ_A1130 [Salmonella enterica subsp. enterica serovar Javiana str. GA_MM04042433]